MSTGNKDVSESVLPPFKAGHTRTAAAFLYYVYVQYKEHTIIQTVQHTISCACTHAAHKPVQYNGCSPLSKIVCAPQIYRE